LRHEVRLCDELRPRVAAELFGEEHLHGDLAPGKLLLVEEHVGETTRAE